MPHYRGTVNSTVKQDELFDYMADFSNAQEWDPGTVSAKRLDSGEIAKGSRFELVVSFAGREMPYTYEVTEYERPNRVVVEADSDATHLTDTMSVAAAEGRGSILTYDAKLDLKGWRNVLAPVMVILFRRLGEKGRAGLERELNRAR
jgi:hypothetical protein